MRIKDKMPDPHQMALLENVNAVLKQLGSGNQWNSPPDNHKAYAPLKGKKLLFVDDTQELLEQFMPYFVVATDGNASFVQHKGEPLDALVDTILQQQPEIIMLDYHLADSLKGSQVAMALKAKGFSGTIVGFSSDDNTHRDFNHAGVTVTTKKGFDPEDSIKQLCKMLPSKQS